ncbi:uncharacterized protein LOC143029732 [Oratosquilla oratoria]|uniref:uncharacterized protein LOC143029732 n=1 Tax=Oratosquilla oratoria TaxID=337810 RepID=UPI003F757DA4
MFDIRLLRVLVLMVVAVVSYAEAQSVVLSSTSGISRGVAESQVVENGVLKGECAYINSEGKQIKIRYSGDTITETEPAGLVNAADHLLSCRRAAEKLASSVAENNKKLAEDLHRQQQEIHDQIMGQQRALQEELQEQQEQLFRNLPRFGPNFPFTSLFRYPDPNAQFGFKR